MWGESFFISTAINNQTAPISWIRPDYRRIAIITDSPSNIGAWTFIGVVRIYYHSRWQTFFFHARRRRTTEFPIDPSIPQDLRSSLRAFVPYRIVASNSLSPLILVADIYSECNRNERQSHDSLTKRPKTLNRTADSLQKILHYRRASSERIHSRQTVLRNFRNIFRTSF